MGTCPGPVYPWRLSRGWWRKAKARDRRYAMDAARELRQEFPGARITLFFDPMGLGGGKGLFSTIAKIRTIGNGVSYHLAHGGARREIGIVYPTLMGLA